MPRAPYYKSKRGDVWYIRFRDPKTGAILTARSSGETNKTKADAWAKAELERLTQATLKPSMTLGEWGGRFFKAGCPHGTRLRVEGKRYSDRTEQTYLALWRLHVSGDELLVLPLGDIRRADLLAFRGRLVLKMGPSRQAQLAYQVVRLVIREAVFQELLDRDPTAGIGQIHYEKKRRPALTLEAMRLLLDPSSYQQPIHHEATLCAALTGLRAGEVRGLQWVDLDPKAGVIRVRHNCPGESTELVAPKWGKERITAYPRVLQGVLERRRGKGFVFELYGGPISYKRWAGAFRSAAGKAKVKASLHSLRHSLLTILREQGIPEDKLRGSFGWSSFSMLENYTHRDLYSQGEQAAMVDTLWKEEAQHGRGSH